MRVENKLKAFTLTELIIIVAILGILASLALPQLKGNIVQAKEATAKGNLHTMRRQIELYKNEHNGVAPGYMGPIQAPISTLTYQFIGTSAANGAASSSKIPTSTYPYGPYIYELPENPFNNLSNIKYVAAATEFADAADGTTSGWLYKKETPEIRLNWTGSDSKGVNYCDY